MNVVFKSVTSVARCVKSGPLHSRLFAGLDTLTRVVTVRISWV